MPLKLADMRKATKTVTFAYGGGDVTVVYKPGLLTPMRRLQIVMGSQSYWQTDKAPKVHGMIEALDSYHADLAELLVSWDVLGDDGKPLAPEAELLKQMSTGFVNALVEALIDDQSVDPQKGKDSDATLPPKD